MIRVFIADDHAVVRIGLRQLIAAEPDMKVVGEAEHGRQVLLAPNQGEWDVLVLDLSLPRVSGMEVLRRLHKERPTLRIVVVSMYAEQHYGPRMKELGAAAYVSKEHPAERVVAAIRAVAHGRPFTAASSSTSDELAEPAGDAPLHDALSPREYQVFLLISQGQTVSEIAAELNVSASTVSVHLHHVKQKLKAHSVGEIVRYAQHAGLLADPLDPATTQLEDES